MDGETERAFDRLYKQGEETGKLLTKHMLESVDRKGKQDRRIDGIERDTRVTKGRIDGHLGNIKWFWRSVIAVALAALGVLLSGSCQ